MSFGNFFYPVYLQIACSNSVEVVFLIVLFFWVHAILALMLIVTTFVDCLFCVLFGFFNSFFLFVMLVVLFPYLLVSILHHEKLCLCYGV